MAKKELMTAQLIKEKKKSILESWKKEIRLHPGRTFEFMTDAEFDEEARAFLEEFAKAISLERLDDITLPQFDKLREILRAVSSKRAQQGFTSSETASFVFSLKNILLAYMQDYFEDAKKLNTETVIMNKLLDDLGLYTFETYAQTRESLIKEQARAINLLQNPLLEVADDIVALPLIGVLDTERAKNITESLLNHVAEHEYRVAILDLTGISALDTRTTNHLLNTAKAVNLMGAEAIITGIRPDVATTITRLGIELKGIPTFSTLKDGIRYASKRAER